MDNSSNYKTADSVPKMSAFVQQTPQIRIGIVLVLLCILGSLFYASIAFAAEWMNKTPTSANMWTGAQWIGEMEGKLFFAMRYSDGGNRYEIYELAADGTVTLNDPPGTWSAVSEAAEIDGVGYLTLRHATNNTRHVYSYDNGSWTDVTPTGTWDLGGSPVLFENKGYLWLQDVSSQIYTFYEIDNGTFTDMTPSTAGLPGTATNAWNSVSHLGEVNGKAYFSFRYSDGGNRYVIYELSGGIFTKRQPAGEWSAVGSLVEFNNKGYTTLRNASNERQVYELDGTMWNDITPTGTWNQAGNPFAFENKLYIPLQETDSAGPYELWEREGTTWDEITPVGPATWTLISEGGQINGRQFVHFRYSDSGNTYLLYELANGTLTEKSPTGSWTSISSQIAVLEGIPYFLFYDKATRIWKVYRLDGDDWTEVTPVSNWDQGGNSNVFGGNSYYLFRENDGFTEEYELWQMAPPPMGTLTIVLDTNVEDDTMFNFDGDGGIGSFSLQDPSNSSISYTLEVGTYTITETVPADWNLANISCTGGSPSTAGESVSVAIGDGDDITCTFSNEEQQGTLNMVLDADIEDDTSFNFNGSGSIGNFALQDPSDTSISYTVKVGTYTITETVPADWSLESVACVGGSFSHVSAGVSVTIGDGDDITCTFANRLQTGTLEVVLDATPEDDSLFSFGGDLGTFDLQDPTDNRITFSDIRVGNYTITETVPTIWALDDVSCIGGNFSSVSEGVSVTVGDEADVTCTFSNSKPTGNVTVILEATPEDNTVFNFDGDLGIFALQDPANNMMTFTELSIGNYTLTEIVPVGWHLNTASCIGGSGHSSITDGVIVNIGEGDNIVCTFGNVNTAASTGNLTIVLDASPEDDTLFSFTGDGGLGAFSLQDPSDNRADFVLTVGAYTITQTVPLSWRLNSVSCIGGSMSEVSDGVEVMINDGDDITCTFRNQWVMDIYLPLVVVAP